MDIGMLVSLAILSAVVSVVTLLGAIYVRDRVLHFIDRHAIEKALGNLPHEIRFYKEAARHGEHGTLLVDSPKHGIRDTVISFVFVGEPMPPAISPMLLEYIWQEGLIHGFVVKELRTYGVLKEIQVPEVEAPKQPTLLAELQKTMSAKAA